MEKQKTENSVTVVTDITTPFSITARIMRQLTGCRRFQQYQSTWTNQHGQTAPLVDRIHVHFKSIGDIPQHRLCINIAYRMSFKNLKIMEMIKTNHNRTQNYQLNRK